MWYQQGHDIFALVLEQAITVYFLVRQEIREELRRKQ